MATTIVTKYGSDAPAASDLVRGELAVDTENGRLYTENSSGAVVEIGLNPSGNVDVTGSVTADSFEVDDTDDIRLRFLNASTFKGGLQIATTAGDMIATSAVDDLAIRSQTNMLFATGGNTEAMRISSAGNVGIGNQSPPEMLTIGDTSNTYTRIQFLSSTTGGNTIHFGDGTSADAYRGYINYTHSDDALAFAAGGTERMRIDSSGNVTIKAAGADASRTLSIQGTNGSSQTYQFNIVADGENGAAKFMIGSGGGAATERMRIDSTGTVGVGTSDLPAWDTSVFDGRIRIGARGGLVTTTASTQLTHNTYYNGSYKYIGNDFATRYYSNDGNHVWLTAPSGTANNTITFSSPRMVILNDGNVGIGTDSPAIGGGRTYDVALTIDGGVSGGVEDTGALEVGGSTSVNDRLVGSISYFNGDNSGAGATTRKQVAIIEARSVTSDSNAGDDSGANLTFSTKSEGGSVAERMRISSAGTVGIGMAPDANNVLSVKNTSGKVISLTNGVDADLYVDLTSGLTLVSPSTGTLAFGTSNTERMRLDASGNLLVGKTSTSTSVVGSAMYNYGTIAATRDGSHALDLGRNSSDGAIAVFRKDGTTVGSIGSISSDLYIAEGNSGLRFDGENNQILPASTTASTDGTCNLGASSARFKDLYRSGSTISTSDRNMKQDERDLTEAETRVAQACKGLLKAFRFIDAVQVDGDDARIHFGIIAQDLQAAFEAEGLDATKYAMFRASTFTNNEGNEETRLGVCYENLLAFIIAAI